MCQKLKKNTLLVNVLKNNLCIIAAHFLNIIEKALESCALKVLESRVGSVIWFGTYFTDNLGDQ